MEWFRFYTDSLESRKAQALPPALFKTWVNLLCVARIFEGLIPVDEAAFRLRISDKQARAALEELASRRLMDVTADGTYYPHDWDEHQKESDDSARRKREQRARQKRDESRRPSRDNAMPQSRDMSRDKCGTSPVLDQTRPDTDQNRTEPPLPPTGGRAVAIRDSWAEYVGVFVACGKPLNEVDVRRALQIWISMPPTEQAAALDDAKGRALGSWRTPDLTADPANHLRGRPWTRAAIQRTMPTRGADDKREATHRAIDARLLRDAKEAGIA